jgi:hypothetical protein
MFWMRYGKERVCWLPFLCMLRTSAIFPGVGKATVTSMRKSKSGEFCRKQATPQGTILGNVPTDLPSKSCIRSQSVRDHTWRCQFWKGRSEMANDRKFVPLQEQWKALAEQIADESDPTKILTLTKQLIELLDLVYIRKCKTPTGTQW